MNLRMQDCRSSSRRKPRRQKHWKEPALFWHVWSHPPLAARHSSTSTTHRHTVRRRGEVENSQTALKLNIYKCECLRWCIQDKLRNREARRASHTVAATAVWVEPVSCRAVALVTSGVVGAVLLTAGALLSTLVHVCQTQQARRVKP